MKSPSDVELRELLDWQQLYELLTRYCRAVDRVDDELLLSCYQPDAWQDHGTYKGPIPGLLEHLHGRAMNAEKGPLQHVIANCRFEIEGDVAFGESYVRTVMRSAEGPAQLSFGRYVDRFERRREEWRIAFRQVIIDIPRAGLDPDEFVSGHRDRRDPSYRRR
jgi:hypothetical protein